MKSKNFLRVLVLIVLLVSGCNAENAKKIPIIFDTDIGSDFDDMWALAMLLNSPEFDIKLITTSTGDTVSRAKLTAKFLELAGRPDIPIGIGSANADGNVDFRQKQWIENYDLSKYPGKIYQDGTRAMVETIINSKEKIRLIAVGPVPTIEAALDRDPNIIKNAEVVGMFGCVYRPVPDKGEYNIRKWIPGFKKVADADWKKTITPLDTCGTIVLSGDRYQKVKNRHSKITDALIEAYTQWYKVQTWIDANEINPEKSSSILYDTVAVYLAVSEDFLNIEELPISITDKGRTVVDKHTGVPMRVATTWKDEEAYKDFLVNRIIK